MPSSILFHQPAIRQAEYQLRQYTYSVQSARAAFFPNITLTGELGFESAALRTLLGPGASGSSGSGTAPASPAILEELLASIKQQPHGTEELSLLGHHSVGGQIDPGMLDLVFLLDDLFFDPSHGKA